jgi:hypothetical protein
MNDLNDYHARRCGPGLAMSLALACVIALAACSAAVEDGHAGDLALSAAPTHFHEGASMTPVPAVVDTSIPALGEAVRVGGDQAAVVTGGDGDYRSGPCRVDTPLPEGYPRPTPPGAIELKTYPGVRLAEVAGSGNPDQGMNRAFWPLFNHIKKHEIAMTSPVQMDYAGLEADSQTPPESWSMAFLYRTPDLNAPGVEGTVKVRDADPLTVLAVGLKGDYSMSLVANGRRTLVEFLAANPQWEIAGDWRALYYNGPSLLFWNKWAEVQVPVRASTSAAPPLPQRE